MSDKQNFVNLMLINYCQEKKLLSSFRDVSFGIILLQYGEHLLGSVCSVIVYNLTFWGGQLKKKVDVFIN